MTTNRTFTDTAENHHSPEQGSPAPLWSATSACILLVLSMLIPALAWSYPEVQLLLLSELDEPVFVTHAGDERLFIVERDGRVLVSDAGRVLPTPFLDIRPKIAVDNEGGLLSVAFHPEFATNGFFFVSYTERSSPPISVVARYRVSETDPNRADPESAAALLRFPRPSYYHNGGQLQFGPKDGYLYASFGDGGGPGDPRCLSQRLDGLFGKIVRLDVDRHQSEPPYFAVPPDNPFIEAGNPAPRLSDLIWAKGLRNPWRFSFDRETGDLYIGDSGHHTLEEVDFQPASSTGGENYGWKRMEGSACLADLDDPRTPDKAGRACPPDTPPCGDARYTDPIIDYGRKEGDCAVIGGYVYRGSRIPALQGAYVFSDFCGARLWALKRDAGGAWKRAELLDAGAGVTSFGEDLDGELYVTISKSVYQLAPVGLDPRALWLAGGAVLAALLVGAGVWRRAKRNSGPA